MGSTLEINDEAAQAASGLSIPGSFSAEELDAMHACKILIIDDEQANVRLLERVLTRAGFENFISTTDSQEASTLFIDFQPDLVLTDLLMPHVDGCAVIEQVRAATASDDYLPIVVLTADITPQAKKRTLAAGATDFLTKPFDQIEVLLRIQNLLKARLSHLIIEKHNASLEDSVRQRTLQLERALVELRATQQQVIQQERLAALGAMAGGIAHDFNNALSIIMGFSELLLQDLDSGSPGEHSRLSITTILTAADDAARIVHRLREFYRPDEAADQHLSIDLNQLIEQAVNLTRPRWRTDALAVGRSIELGLELGDIPCITGDAAEMREVLTNLIFNAVDALPEGGTITVTTHLEDDIVVLRIGDTGSGMSDEVRQRCLEPFFTTKGKGGTGLGLSMVFGIIQRHGGMVDIESELGVGTTVLLRLPAATLAESDAAECALPLSRPLHILVVDDQPILCQLLCENLQEDLHTVETAASGGEALEKFHLQEFDVIITDHVMAGMTGAQLATAMKELKPHVPIILLTGYTGEATHRLEESTAVDLVLAKPLTRACLRQSLAGVLAELQA